MFFICSPDIFLYFNNILYIAIKIVYKCVFFLTNFANSPLSSFATILSIWLSIHSTFVLSSSASSYWSLYMSYIWLIPDCVISDSIPFLKNINRLLINSTSPILLNASALNTLYFCQKSNRAISIAFFINKPSYSAFRNSCGLSDLSVEFNLRNKLTISSLLTSCKIFLNDKLYPQMFSFSVGVNSEKYFPE